MKEQKKPENMYCARGINGHHPWCGKLQREGSSISLDDAQLEKFR